jgi:hypothetical protein
VTELETICDGGRPLIPVRYNSWRHGTVYYKITATGPGGEPVPVGVIDDLDAYLAESLRDPAFAAAYRAAQARICASRPRRLVIDGHEYRRRQRARLCRR